MTNCIDKKQTMKRINDIIAMVGLVVMASCSPRVVADLETMLPPRTADSLMIYEAADSMPAEAAKIGTVKVVDGGMTLSKNCKYRQMLTLAADKTMACGGNALRIDKQRKPDRISTCHRIWGTMFLLPESQVTQPAAVAIEKQDSQRDKELVAQMMAQDSVRRAMLPENVVKLKVGPSWITSDYIVDGNNRRGKAGIDFGVEYQHLWRAGLGVGAVFQHFSTSFDEGLSTSISFVGPSFVASTMLGDKVRWTSVLSLGYSQYREHVWNMSYSQGGFGLYMTTGLEYMLAKNVGLGCDFMLQNVNLKSPPGVAQDSNKRHGVSRIGLQASLCFYF